MKGLLQCIGSRSGRALPRRAPDLDTHAATLWRRPGFRQIVAGSWGALKPVLWPAVWLFIAHTMSIMVVDRLTHRTVNEGATPVISKVVRAVGVNGMTGRPA